MKLISGRLPFVSTLMQPSSGGSICSDVELYIFIPNFFFKSLAPTQDSKP